MPSSKVKVAIAQVLKDEGYIEGFQVHANDGKPELRIGLKYYAGRPVIESLERVSRPRATRLQGARRHSGRDERPGRGDRLDLARVMTDRKARSQGVGGEVLCYVA